MLGEWARPQLAALVDATGETANLAVLDGDGVVYVAQVPSRHTMRMFTEVGRRVPGPLHGGGQGAAGPSCRLPGERPGGPRRHAGRDPAHDHRPGRLARELDPIRHEGYAVDDAEQELGVRCVAVALDDAPLQLALSISGPAPRMTERPPVASRAGAHPGGRRLRRGPRGVGISGTRRLLI